MANSDTDEDQQLKLAVRDKVIELSKQLEIGVESIDTAKELLAENLESIADVASEEISRLGFDYPVEVCLSEEEYPTKTYASLCFPEGKQSEA